MNKLLIITGGSRGIGRATLALFQQQGWQVINLSRHHCKLEGAKQIDIDLTQLPKIEALKPQLLPLVQQTDQCCLVHNACHLMHDSVGNQDLDALQHSLTLSITSVAALNNLLVPAMKPSSSIFYIGSTLSDMAVTNSATYVTIKHATVGIMRASCQDLANTGIHTACICPGFTDTGMLREHLSDEEAIQWAKSRVGANRLVEPSEIAELLLFCANNSTINGALLHANLGQLQS